MLIGQGEVELVFLRCIKGGLLLYSLSHQSYLNLTFIMVAASSLLFGFAALSCLPNVLAQGNPGQCPADNGQYRTTSIGELSTTR